MVRFCMLAEASRLPKKCSPRPSDGLGMRRLFGALLLPAIALAEPWSLEKLFTRPFVWGTPPSEITWSKQGLTLLFLWNAEGGRFRDLYAYHPAEQKVVRLTDMEPVRDDLNRGEAEKDERRKQYLIPPEGIAAFQMSRDGRRGAAVNDWENYNAFYTEQRLMKPQQTPEAYRRS